MFVQPVSDQRHRQRLVRRAPGHLQTERLDDHVVGVDRQVRAVVLDGAEGEQDGRLPGDGLAHLRPGQFLVAVFLGQGNLRCG